MPQTTQKAFDKADAVFYGIVTSVSKVARGGAYHFSFNVEKAWKGVPEGRLTLYTNKSSASCGIGMVSAGQRYLFYATAWPHKDKFKVDSCNRYSILSNAGKEIRELDKLTENGEKQ